MPSGRFKVCSAPPAYPGSPSRKPAPGLHHQSPNYRHTSVLSICFSPSAGDCSARHCTCEAPPLLVTPRGSVAHVSLLFAVANFYTAQATGWYTRELRPPEETAMILGSVCGSFFPGIWDCFSHLPHAPLTVRGLRGQQTSNVRGACARQFPS